MKDKNVSALRDLYWANENVMSRTNLMELPCEWCKILKPCSPLTLKIYYLGWTSDKNCHMCSWNRISLREPKLGAIKCKMFQVGSDEK